VRRLVLIRHAPTAATRAFAFPVDEEPDERGLEAAAGLRLSVPTGHEVLSSPSRRCLATASAAQLGDPVVDPLLAECDFGSWAGRTLDGLPEGDVAAWMTDPDSRPHGGESQRSFCGRVAGWLDGQAGLDGSAVAITHGGVVKAAVVHALGAPIEAFWRVDATPLAVTELHAHDGRWTVSKVNAA
jgi:broad specificity phosphatase PhoE